MDVENVKKENNGNKTVAKRKATISNGMETAVYDINGKEVSKVKLPESVFGVKWNSDLVHQTVTSMQSSARNNVAHTKDRSEVRGGGKKPWRQKGTGRARHGSNRSPIWVGGGVTHGPRNDKNYDRKVNKKMRAKALYTILSKKHKDGEILFVDQLKLDGKTKSAKNILSALSKIKGFESLAKKKKSAAYVALGENDANVLRSFKNFGNIYADRASNLNPVSLLSYKYLIIDSPEKVIEFFKNKLK